MSKKIFLMILVFFSFAHAEVKGISLETLKSTLRDKMHNLKNEDKEGWKGLLKDIEEDEKVYPDEIFFPYWKIYVYEHLEDDEGTLKTVDEVLKKDEGFKELYEIKGDILFKQKKYQEAIDVYSKGLEHAKGISDFFLRIGKSYEFMGDYAKAIDYYTRYSFMNPKDSRVYVQIAKVYILLDDAKKEFEALKKGLDKTKDDVFLYYTGSYYEQHSDADKAIDFYKQYLDKVFDKGVVLRLAGLYRMIGKLEEAKNLYDEALRRNPSDFIFQTQRSHVCMDLRNDVCTEESLQKLTTLPESTSQSGIDLMIFYQKKNEQEKALKTIDKTIEKYPDQKRLYGYRGDIELLMGDLDKASSDYDMMKDSYPEEYEKASIGLGQAQEKKKSAENEVKSNKNP